MIENYIFEDIQSLDKRTINNYQKMIDNIGTSYLDEHHYKVANIYTMLKLDKEHFQQIAPECFSSGAKRMHYLPDEYLKWMTEQQIQQVVKKYSHDNIFSVEILRIWKVSCQDNKTIGIIEKMIDKKLKEIRNILYLKGHRFYSQSNMISVKDAYMYLYSFDTLDIEKKRQKLQSNFEDCFIDNQVLDYAKTLARINEIYTGNEMKEIHIMSSLLHVSRKYFLICLRKYGPNDALLKKVILHFELRKETNKIPVLKLGTQWLYYYEDVEDYLAKKIT